MTTDDDERGLLPFEEGHLIRQQWHDGQWYFSVVDVVGLLSEAASARTYWAQLKAKLGAEGASETLQDILPLKMRALDGKLRLTDATNVETMLRIIESIPSPKAEPVKQWLARLGAERLEDALAERNEAERRMLIRGEVAEKNTSLNSAASGAGVLSRRDFAIFHDSGYQGMYNGEGENAIHARKGLAKGEKILDWMGSEELAANLFRITQTEAKLRRDSTITTKEQANQTHHDIGRVVRKTIAELGGTMPEDLPTPPQSIQQIDRQEQKRLESKHQPSLFGNLTESEEEKK
jgi:DNA-damage-inducible protein D